MISLDLKIWHAIIMEDILVKVIFDNLRKKYNPSIINQKQLIKSNYNI